jgi:type IX secretion system PorP/SprF family membrane protein
MKRLYIFLIAIMAGPVLHAQQLPHFSQYMLNEFAENPAVAGKNPFIEASSVNRNQWIGITDAPRTYLLSVNGPLKNDHFGVGGQLFTDITGPTRRTGFYLSYAYRMTITKDIKLSLGVDGGILQFMVDGSKINLKDMTDNVMSTGLQSILLPDFGFGVYINNKDKWYAGVSAPQIMQDKIKFFDYSSNTSSMINRHYFLSGGYKYNVNENFALLPSTMIRFVDPAPVQFDLSLRVSYRNMVWVGTSYRNLDAWVAMAGYTFRENISAGYAYDFSTTNIKNYSSGSHEIFVALRFNRKPPADVKK